MSAPNNGVCVCNEKFRTAEDYRDHLPCNADWTPDPDPLIPVFDPVVDGGDRQDPATVEEELAALRALADEMDEKDNRISELEGKLDQAIAQREEAIRQQRLAENRLENHQQADRDDRRKLYPERAALVAYVHELERRLAQEIDNGRQAFASGWAEGVVAGNEAGEITGYARGWADATSNVN